MIAFELPIAIIMGFILDYILGDPEVIPHPVVLIGKGISFFEGIIRRVIPSSKVGELVGGTVLGILIVAMSTLVPLLILMLAGRISIWLKIALEIFWCWQIFAARTLDREAQMVYDKVNANDLDGARKQVGRIVGRDTGALSMTEIIKACIETVAESTSDGVIAPMFYLFIFGVPGGFFYKSVNTLDSMVGYKNERYRYFGSFSARLDDVANFIPSRITGLAMCLAAWIMRGDDSFDGRNALRIWLRDRLKHLSPNSGNPEAACAGALGLELGGDAYYFGKKYEKATLGDSLRNPEPHDIRRSVKLMYLTSVLCLLIFSVIKISAIILIK